MELLRFSLASACGFSLRLRLRCLATLWSFTWVPTASPSQFLAVPALPLPRPVDLVQHLQLLASAARLSLSFAPPAALVPDSTLRCASSLLRWVYLRRLLAFPKRATPQPLAYTHNHTHAHGGSTIKSTGDDPLSATRGKGEREVGLIQDGLRNRSPNLLTLTIKI